MKPLKTTAPETKIFPSKTRDGLAASTMSIPQKRPRTDEHSEKHKQASRSMKNASPDSGIIVSKSRKRSRRNQKLGGSKEVSGPDIDRTSSQKQTANVNSWEISKICGGRFTPKSLFSKDEKYAYFL